MQTDAFRQVLKRQGKRSHVVDRLVAQVAEFEKWLQTRPDPVALDEASAADVDKYLHALEVGNQGAGKQAARGIAVYFRMIENEGAAALAAQFRGETIAAARKPFLLNSFKGIAPLTLERLRQGGVTNVEELLDGAKTREQRRALAARTGAPEPAILELVKLADLSRLGAIKGVRARLYYDAGVDTPEKMAQWEPEALRAMLADFVRRTGFDGIAPLPKEVWNAVSAARSLPRLVEY